MWLKEPRFKWGEEVWSTAPMFAHGFVLGYWITKGGTISWIIQTVGGNILFVEDKNLHQARKPLPLARSIQCTHSKQ